MSSPQPSSRLLWLRWSWRDLRQRWLLVTAVAVIIAVGTGMFAGLGGTSRWRTKSYDASYDALAMHDVRVQLPPGATVAEGTLLGHARGIAHAEAITAVEERLIVPTQVDASHASATVLVPGRLVGAAANGDRAVDRLHVFAGARTAPVVLESKFADYYDLPATGSLRVSGPEVLEYGAVGVTPEFFRVSDRSAGLYGEANLAIVFVPLDTAQELAGQRGMVNDLVLRLEPGTEPDVVAKELATAVAVQSGTVTTRDEDTGRRALYEAARNDQQTWNVFALVILFGASFASFNLISRIVESERRQIGVGMALGVNPRVLAARHFLVGAQVALIGVVAGVGVGWIIGGVMRDLYMDLQPLPVWRTPFPVGRYAEAAALGIVLPLLATVLPVWRAVRVEPVRAFRTSAYADVANSDGVFRFIGARPIRRHVIRQLAFRNVLRAPRRTLLTGLGVAGSIAAFIAVLGVLDSYVATASRADRELTRTNADRVFVRLDRFYAWDAAEVRAIIEDPAVGQADRALLTVGTVRANHESVFVVPELIDMDGGLWTPSLGGGHDATRGIVLAEKAARDLGVEPGDTVVLRHPKALGGSAFSFVNDRVVVAGVHPLPLRVTAYMDTDFAALFGLEESTNALVVNPADGVSGDDLRRALFEHAGVTSTEEVDATTEGMRRQLSSVVGVLRVVQVGVLALALLIAFNSASITVDERVREEATMFAFGLPLRSVLGLLVIESAIAGVVGTVVGYAGGLAVVDWIVNTQLAASSPEFGIRISISTGSIVATVVLGVGAVALAPLFMARKLHRMDIPAALRVAE